MSSSGQRGTRSWPWFARPNISASAPNQTVLSLGYDFHLGKGDNGNVWGITNYRDQGYRVYFTAAKTGLGMDELPLALAGKLTVFCGHSGVGKNTLLKKLTGREDIILGAVNALTEKGRQTTTTAPHKKNGSNRPALYLVPIARPTATAPR